MMLDSRGVFKAGVAADRVAFRASLQAAGVAGYEGRRIAHRIALPRGLFR